MKLIYSDSDQRPSESGESPALRLFSLLELMGASEHLYSLTELIEQTGWPKPTLHRMLQQLESGGLLQRTADGRRYAAAARLRRFAGTLLLNDTRYGAQHAVLRHLVDEVGESCNLTALVGNEVMYLDRVETAAPLRFYLQAGSRVPLHCSASGKVFLAQMTPSQRTRLLGHAPLDALTAKTITSLDALEREVKRVKKQGFALDDEEFLPGLTCIAVLVPHHRGASNLCIAVQAPIMRATTERTLHWLPALQRAAQSLADIEREADRTSQITGTQSESGHRE
jgi:IclR family transcriptional regulator, acetate operon repressor